MKALENLHAYMQILKSKIDNTVNEIQAATMEIAARLHYPLIGSVSRKIHFEIILSMKITLTEKRTSVKRIILK